MEVPDEVEPADTTKEEDAAAVDDCRYQHNEFTDVDIRMSSPQSTKAKAQYGGSKTPG